MSRKRVLIAHILGAEGKKILRDRDDIDVVEFPNTLEQAEFQALLRSFDAVHGVVLGLTRFGPAELQSAAGLQVVSRIGVGFDAVDIPAMTEAAIPVMVCANANHRAVAEHTLGFMLSLAKRTGALSHLVRNGDWHQRYDYLPSELEGREALLVGCGRIGSRVATLLVALGMRVNVYDPYLLPGQLPHGAEAVAVLEEGLASADYVSLHCPKNAETVGLLSAERLACMKPQAYVINTARGGIVDEQALYQALVEKRIAGAALDVFLPEPPPYGKGLPSLDNVICSPHLAGVSREAVSRMAKLAAGNVLDVFDADPNHENAVNPEVFDHSFFLADAAAVPYPI
ncbi:hydroxyacid dehydrogenase [Pseudomonas syringae group genomosp. 3]|uniref:D-3-phosphoglycerate dehydrogenase n=1 Tax=Pseudomonas syringae pv. primulae TaxID=251707 RepID=A0A3M5TUH3_9PSED|nr:hydroxyacid dehydrogenase [Pseudomonas syringae group genomosp. 3]RMO68866.1 D-3-phosphoglycerate dehydrogenase [Pseudomonas syringae pv. primulae]RMU36657.1 D-3-phosphoglycerate dehydrogenase [Pseudomonas syringae pv. primulae]